MKVELKLTIELSDEWKGSGDVVTRQLMDHYDDLGHLAEEHVIIQGTVETEDGYFATNKQFTNKETKKMS